MDGVDQLEPVLEEETGDLLGLFRRLDLVRRCIPWKDLDGIQVNGSDLLFSTDTVSEDDTNCLVSI